MHVLQTHIVPPDVKTIRLSEYARQIFEIIPSRKGIKKAIKRGEVRVDGEMGTTGHWVQPGQCIELVDLELKAPKVYELSLEVIYEDDFMAIVNKPAGIPVSGNQFRNIENCLLFNLRMSDKPDALKWPKPVHRLDVPTQGLLVVAKTVNARIKLGKQFEERAIQKQYQAVVMGQVPEKGLFDQMIEGRKAITSFQLSASVPSLRNGTLSLVDLFPETGRKHQLRIHLANAGFPILGDKQYGPEGKILKYKGLFLAAVGLTFPHPITGKELRISIKTPYKFRKTMERTKSRWDKYQEK